MADSKKSEGEGAEGDVITEAMWVAGINAFDEWHDPDCQIGRIKSVYRAMRAASRRQVSEEAQVEAVERK